MRHTIAWVSVVFMAGAVAACGGSSSGDSNNPDNGLGVGNTPSGTNMAAAGSGTAAPGNSGLAGTQQAIAGTGAGGAGAAGVGAAAGVGVAGAGTAGAGTAGTGTAGAGTAGAGTAGTGTMGPDFSQHNQEVEPTDECGIDSGFPGDEWCILPPPPDEGFQIHIGPDDYNNINPNFMLNGGQEFTRDFQDVSSNTEQRYYYFRQIRFRPGTHHMIATEGTGLGGRRVATANGRTDTPPGGIIAPENEGVGTPIAPRTTINVSHHAINVTQQPILTEVWINFWYRDPSVVTEPTTQLFLTGDVTFAIPPGADTMLGPFTCNVTGSGRLLWLYGHRHASNVEFSAWRKRGVQQDLIYEGLDWEEPLWLEYSSTIQNPVADPAAGIEGGWSGILDLQAGDQIVWQCHVINKQPGTLRFTNETYAGEMCIVDAETVGANCGGLLGF